LSTLCGTLLVGDQVKKEEETLKRWEGSLSPVESKWEGMEDAQEKELVAVEVFPDAEHETVLC
jgi:hypothetical protein